MSNRNPPGNLILRKRPISNNSGAVIGYCHNLTHQGELTAKIIKEHDCIKKECPFLEKYENAEYWRQLEDERCEHQKARASAKVKKRWKSEKNAFLAKLKEGIQDEARRLEVEIEITSVRRIKHNYYQVFYVSDNSYGDFYSYHDFHKHIKSMYPEAGFLLSHIKDANGNFVTREEYQMWKKRQ